MAVHACKVPIVSRHEVRDGHKVSGACLCVSGSVLGQCRLMWCCCDENTWLPCPHSLLKNSVMGARNSMHEEHPMTAACPVGALCWCAHTTPAAAGIVASYTGSTAAAGRVDVADQTAERPDTATPRAAAAGTANAASGPAAAAPNAVQSHAAAAAFGGSVGLATPPAAAAAARGALAHPTPRLTAAGCWCS